MEPEAIVVFLRLPRPGRVKTRIAATIGDALALEIYEDLLKSTFRSLAQVPMPVFLFYEGGLPPISERDTRYTYHLQMEGTLDKKIAHALSSLLEKFNKVIIMGSDCPELTPPILLDSFHQLDSSDVVIGPAKDGGFYLFGCQNLHPTLLDNINWSTSSVLTQLLINIQRAELTYALLEKLSDIDTEEDWKAFSKRKTKSGRE